MGTRCLICVVKGGEYKIAQFGRGDGYPSYTGVKILNFLKRIDLTAFAEKVSQVRFYSDEESVQINKEVDSYLESIQGEKWHAIRDEDYERYRNPTTELDDKYFSQPYIHVQGKLSWEILEFVLQGNTPPLDNSIKFAGDSLFCDWAYVIDLDVNQFEVYRGFNKEPVPDGERFANFEGYKEFYPVTFLSQFDINNLPPDQDFLDQCRETE